MFKTERRQEYKKGIDSSEQRRKRTENTIELRKNKRDEQLTKRRVHGDQPFQFGAAAADNNSENNVKVNQQDQYTLNDLNMLVQHMCNSDPQLQLKATKGIRRLLSIESNPPIDEVMAAGVLPIVVKMLPMVNHPELIFEAAWVLTNMASGTSKHVRQLIEAGTVQSFVALLNTPNLTADVYDQVAWAIGNIAGDNIQCRDFVLKCGALAPLIRLCENRRNNLSRLRDAVWVISNLCRGKPQPDFELIKGVVPLLSSVLESKDAEVLTDACWALSYISDDNTKNNIKIQAIIESGVVQRVVHLLLHHDSNIKTPCLRTVGNMVTGNDAQTQHVLDCGMLPALKQLLVSGKKSIRKEACWAISNVTAGTPQQIQSVIDAGLLPSLVQILGASEHDVRKEVAWVVSNIVASGREDQIRALTEFSVLPPLCELLKSSDSALVIACLDSLSSILAIGQKDAMRNGGDNAYSIILESCGGVDDLALLQDSEQQEVQSKASTILNAYFDAEEEVGDACNIAPAVTGNQFSFGDSTSTSFSFGANTNSQPFSF